MNKCKKLLTSLWVLIAAVFLTRWFNQNHESYPDFLDYPFHFLYKHIRPLLPSGQETASDFSLLYTFTVSTIIVSLITFSFLLSYRFIAKNNES